MRPLQDRCEPTPYEDIERLFLTDMGRPIDEVFDEFDPQPIGVASLAQVHIGRWKQSGELVAVKVKFIRDMIVRHAQTACSAPTSSPPRVRRH